MPLSDNGNARRSLLRELYSHPFGALLMECIPLSFPPGLHQPPFLLTGSWKNVLVSDHRMYRKVYHTVCRLSRGIFTGLKESDKKFTFYGWLPHAALVY